MSSLIDVAVPDIGDFESVEVIEIAVAVGDTVELEQTLLTLESDKASMDIPSSAIGVVEEILVKVGDSIAEGTVVVRLKQNADVSDSVKTTQNSALEAPTKGEKEPAETSPQEIDIHVPDIGDFDAVEVIELNVAVGDVVEKEQTLLTLESDKASMEIPSTAAGTVKAIHVAVGDKVAEGALIIVLSAQVAGQETAKPVKQDAKTIAPAIAAERPKPVAASHTQTHTTSVSAAHIHASPAVRKFARELGVDLSTVTKASGPKGRLLKDDVKSHVKQILSSGAATGGSVGSGIPPIPTIDFSKFGAIEQKPLSKIKRLTGTNLTRAWLNVPMVTHHELADITEMEAFRKSLKADAEKRGVKVTFLAFIMKALAAALKEFPQFNASLSPDGQSLIYKKYYNLGIAVATPNGLVVPVFKDVDKTNIFDLAAQMSVVSNKARDGKLMPKDMQGACMTISSLGGIGGTAFTPIVNAPEVAILGVTRGDMQPIWNGKEFIPRLMLPLDLTYDHRVIDGADAAAFMVAMAGYLNDIRRVLL